MLLGHVISQRGIEADPNKVQALIDMHSPSTAKQLISFLQKVRYLSRFIHLLSELVTPLQALAHADAFIWADEHQQRYEKIKQVLTSLPTIAPPKWDQEFFVNPSAGDNALGVVLMQKEEQSGYMRPIHFASRVMTVGEKNYTPLEQAVCALMFATTRFRSYLLPRRFTIISVEDTFLYALQHMGMSARISKWLTQVQGFDYTITTEHTTRASLADILTHRVYERKVRVPRQPTSDTPPPPPPLRDAHTLHFDGAYKRKLGRQPLA